MSETVTTEARAAALPELEERFPQAILASQETRDAIPTYWVDAASLHPVVAFLKSGIDRPYKMLYDLHAMDERMRADRAKLPAQDLTVVYHLLSFERNADVRLKVALPLERPELQTITDLWPAANWFEREAWDMLGVRFAGHPHLERILMPRTWKGHPLRKDHPARATEMGPFQLTDERREQELEALRFRPEEWGMRRESEDAEFLFLNLGPQHPGTHGVLRLVLQLEGERIVDMVPEIGFHHRGAEKMGERQTWHSYIPYTDRIDYLGGVMNNMAYLLAVEKLAGIELPERAKVIRIMMCELFRIASHLVWYGTFAQDIGSMSPVFYMFTDRERIFSIVEAVCGGRMHPSWFRIGGVAHDLPKGWDKLVRDFVDSMPKRLAEYYRMVMKNQIFKARTQGVGTFTLEEAIEWGVTGPGLRACGYAWDFRKKRPYGGYDQLDFEVPTAASGDCYARAEVRIEEINQSLKIVRQCLDHMPEGAYKADHPLALPPVKDRTMLDIETLITHFLSVSWGPVIPPGEAFAGIEATKGNNGYYLVSDGNIHPYRVRIRAPSFAHMQMLPRIARGQTVADLLAILGAMDFVLADIDR